MKRELLEGDRVLVPDGRKATIVKAGNLICEVRFDYGFEPLFWWFTKKELQLLREGKACDARGAAA